MIRAQQTKDILKIAKKFHRELSVRYEDLSETATNPKIKMLLEGMSRHENEMINSLNIYEKEMSEKVLNYFFRFLPEPETTAVCREIDTSQDYTLDDTVKLSFKIDSCLRSLYESVINHSTSTEVQTVFKRLLKAVKHNKYVVSRESLELGEL